MHACVCVCALTELPKFHPSVNTSKKERNNITLNVDKERRLRTMEEGQVSQFKVRHIGGCTGKERSRSTRFPVTLLHANIVQVGLTVKL